MGEKVGVRVGMKLETKILLERSEQMGQSILVNLPDFVNLPDYVRILAEPTEDGLYRIHYRVMFRPESIIPDIDLQTSK